MKKYVLSLLAMFFFGFVAIGQITIYEDNFDSYTSGEQLVLENPVNWTTWSNTPGSAEDPVISSDYSSTSPNSVKITGTNDAVLLLEDKTAGKYNIVFKMYIPAGNLGYFNVLQDFAGASSQWGLQVYFDAGGLGLLDGNGAGAATFTFGYDQWIDLKVFVNLDDDWCMFYVNNALIHEYQWSLGTFGTGTLNKLDGVNFYAWNVGGNPLYYVDNVLYEMVTDNLLVEDFESYTAGQKLVQQAVAQGKDYWTTWSNAPGGAEDPMVSSAQSLSGVNSVVIDGTNDAVLLLGDKVSGAYAVEFNIFVPNGLLGYFNILQLFNGASSEWGMQAYFDQGGLGLVDAGGAGAGVFNYSYDTWIPVKCDIDLNADFAELFIDGTSVVTWVWSTGSFGTGNLKQLGAVNFYAWNVGGTPGAFFDDITFTQTAPPGGDPVINVTPASLTESLEVGQTSTQSITISNTGVVDLDYSILVSYVTALDATSGGHAGRNTAEEAAAMAASTLTADDLSVVTGLNSPSAPANSDDEVLLHYDGENSSAVGLTNGGTYEVAAMFPAAMVGEYIGMEITEVQVYINDPANGYKIKIYGQDLPNRPGALLYEQLFSGVAGAWNTVTLWTPLVNTGGDLWVAYEIVQNLAGVFPAGTDAGPANANGDWIKTGATWARLSVLNPALNYNWNIRAKLVGEPIQAWLSVDPGMGTLEPNMSQDVTVTFNAAGLTAGTYMASINISSNDPATPMVTVPVTLEVGGTGPSLTVVAELDFESIPDWSFTFDPWLALDVDQLPTYGFTNTTFPGAYEPMAYIAFNPATTDPPMTGDAQIQPHGGVRFGACMASTSAPWNNDWMISPQVELGTDSKLTLWVKSYTAQYGLERYKIGVSTTGTNPADFTIISTLPYLEAPATGWEEKMFDLSAYDNETVYVGIQCISQDAFVFMIDDIKIETMTNVGIVDQSTNAFNIYPNPASDVVTINGQVALKQVKVMNYTGQVVYQSAINGMETTFSTRDLSAGMYILQVETAEGWSSQKLMIK
ncbi:MAG: T9SS type A sorting domain-containing protein [Bacteroidales bacterium]|nr:T9SS type A sorting domain-containing protein [Bacteroidales bacterium]